MQAWLSKPYPLLLEAKVQWRVVIGFGLFIMLFLFIFQPFGMSVSPIGRQFLYSAAYGAVTSAIMAFNFFLLPKIIPGFFSEKSWNIGREISIILFSVALIGAGNFLLTALLFGLQFTLWGFLFFEAITLIIGAIPITALVMINYVRVLKRNLEEANLLNQNVAQYRKKWEPEKFTKQEGILVLPSQDENSNLCISPAAVLSMAASGNYVEVHYREGDKLQKHLLRNTLKNLSGLLYSYPQFAQVHRSYIVNLQQVVKAEGNSRGMLLYLEKSSQTIPVSRSNIRFVEEYFR